MFYKNISNATKTFYGITFKPGDVKEVPGYINDAWFERCAKPKAQSKSTEQKSEQKSEKSAETKPTSSSNKSTKNEDKEETVDGTNSN